MGQTIADRSGKTREGRMFLSSRSVRQWKKIGPRRRAGVATPLFSIFSSDSVGIGEIPDLKHLVRWCRKTGLGIIQLLPMNDVGYHFMPYDAKSTFALEPMHLSLRDIAGISPGAFEKEIDQLRRRFPAGRKRVDYGIKGVKMEMLWKIFHCRDWNGEERLSRFTIENSFWLRDYSIYKVIKGLRGESEWESWEEPLRTKQAAAIATIEKENLESVRFQQWLQWQLYEQFRSVKKMAEKENVLFMGDLPFLVSRDSADVWSNQGYFKLDMSAGSPPDMYFADGQRWGMPPYDWKRIADDGYSYLKEKIKFAENFYDLFRIDHAVGMFRIWVTPFKVEKGRPARGIFDPEDESQWESHGERLFAVMTGNTLMLPCAEDLGTVPKCSYKVLKEFGIPGMDVQRWSKDWGKTYDYVKPEDYRVNGISVISTHDTTSLKGWWEFEIGTIDEAIFRGKCASRGVDFESVKGSLFDIERSRYGRLRWRKDVQSAQRLLQVLRLKPEEARDFVDLHAGSFDEQRRFLSALGTDGEPPEKMTEDLACRTLNQANATASIFSIQLLQDWFTLEPSFNEDPWEFRINFPGTISEKNWSLVMPWSLEEMHDLGINPRIRNIVEKSERTV